ncbi:MarR family transcriptional regulator [Fulvimonas soli]|nr:MarR family transcriptional regulator [Fulvimonas soli]
MKTEREPWRDYTARAGGAALGARLRRVSERIDRELSAFYAHLGVDFEQRWFGVLNLLDLFGSMGVGQLAEALAISHVSVSQTKESLERAGLVEVRADEQDARRRNLRLTRRGCAFVRKMRPVWEALAESARALDEEAGEVVRALDALEKALDRSSVAQRALRHLKAKNPL